MGEIRLIVTDLDGTYLDHGAISEQNKRAVALAQAGGVKVMACTGRTWAMCDWLIPTLGFDDFCVTSNGASIVHTQSGEIVYRMRLDPQWLPPLFEAAMKSGRPFDVFCGPFIHTYSPQRSQWTLRSEALPLMPAKGQNIKLRHFDDYQNWLMATKDVAELFRVEVAPGMPYPKEMRQVIKAYDMGGNITMSYLDHWDLCHPSAGKANAIEFICQRLNITSDNVMALGDSNNDTDMLRYAGLGVAMGDAADEVKKAADVVSPPCAENGFAWAIYQFVLKHAGGKTHAEN